MAGPDGNGTVIKLLRTQLECIGNRNLHPTHPMPAPRLPLILAALVATACVRVGVLAQQATQHTAAWGSAYQNTIAGQSTTGPSWTPLPFTDGTGSAGTGRTGGGAAGPSPAAAAGGGGGSLLGGGGGGSKTRGGGSLTPQGGF